MLYQMKLGKLLLFTVVVLAVIAAPALAQSVQASAPPQPKQGIMVRISDKATYNDALKCFHYYAIAHETASRFAAQDKATAEQKAALGNQAKLAKFLQAQWQGRITKTKGDKSEDAVNADLQKIGAPMLADANKALSGDKAARERGSAQGKACSALQETSKFTPPAG